MLKVIIYKVGLGALCILPFLLIPEVIIFIEHVLFSGLGLLWVISPVELYFLVSLSQGLLEVGDHITLPHRLLGQGSLVVPLIYQNVLLAPSLAAQQAEVSLLFQFLSRVEISKGTQL